MQKQNAVYVVLGLPDGTHQIIKDVRDPEKTYLYPVYGVFDTFKEAKQYVEDDTPDEGFAWRLQYG